MSYQYLQGAAASGNGVTSLAATFANNVQAGSKIIVFITTTSVTATPDAPTSGAFTWTAVGPVQTGTPQGALCQQMFFLDTPGALVGTKPTITSVLNANASGGISIIEVGGLLPGNTTACLDGSQAAAMQAGAASVAQPAITSTVASEFMAVGYGDNGGPAIYKVPSTGGYSADNNNGSGIVGAGINDNSNADNVIGYKATIGGAESGTWTFGGTPTAEGCGFIIAIFKLAQPGGAPPLLPPTMFPPLSRIFGPNPPFYVQPVAPAAPTTATISGTATMAAQSGLTILSELEAPVTMAAQSGLTVLGSLEAPVTMAAATALTTPNELESPVTLAAASALSEVETLPTIATLAAAAGLSPVEALPTVATMAASSALTGPGGLAIPVTLASNSTLSNLNALGVSFTAAAALSEAETLEAPVTITAGSGLTTPSAQEAVVALTAAAAVTSPSELADLVSMAGAATLLTGSQNIAATLAITSAFTPGSAGGAGVSMSAASVLSALDALETNPLLSAAATFSPVEALPTLASFAALATLVAIGGAPPPAQVKAFGFATVTGDPSTSTVGTTEGPPSTVTGDLSAASVTGDLSAATVAGDAGGGSTVT